MVGFSYDNLSIAHYSNLCTSLQLRALFSFWRIGSVIMLKLTLERMMETWYRVSRWADRESDIKEANNVVKSTEKCLFFAPHREGAKPSRSNISSNYENWFKTREEAENRLNSLIASKKNHADQERIKRAAPQLLEALQEITEMYCAMINSGDCGNWNPEEDKEVTKARAAIKAATE